MRNFWCLPLSSFKTHFPSFAVGGPQGWSPDGKMKTPNQSEIVMTDNDTSVLKRVRYERIYCNRHTQDGYCLLCGLSFSLCFHYIIASDVWSEREREKSERVSA